MQGQETTSSKKIAKKARQYYRREMKKEAQELGRTIGNAIQPKPWWIPMWLWWQLVGLVLKIRK